jgi:biopolymer transport protein ExbB
MFVLLFLSLVSIALTINKYRLIININKKNKKITTKMLEESTLDKIVEYIDSNSIECPLSNVMRKAKSVSGKEYSVIRDSIESVAVVDIHKLENGLGWLSTIAAVAPLIGFLGTVTGMVRVFINIAANSQQGVDIALLSNGIWEALLTTVGGLIVGIPTIIFYNDLVSHIENNAKLLQEHVDSFLLKNNIY